MRKSKFLNAMLKGFLFPMCLVLGATGGEGTASGGEGNNGDQLGEGPASAADNAAKNDGAAKTFSQEDLNRVAAKEKAEGRRALLKELGIEDTDDAKAAIKQYLADQEARKTEAQKATERANKAEKAQADAEATALAYQHRFEALAAGANPDTVDDLITIASKKVNDKTDFKAALELTKKAYPVFFGTGTQDKRVGTGGSPNHTRGNGNQVSMGERLAKNRMSNSAQESPFFKKNF